MTATTVTVATDPTTPRGHCTVPEATLRELSIGAGRQVRLRRDGTCALFTVVPSDRSVVTVHPDGPGRLGVESTPFDGALDTQVPHPTYDRAGAEAESEFVERAVERGSRLVVCAPHGGYVEYGTDEQAARLADWLGGTLWLCAGWNSGGGAYRRWHVSSTEIHPDSFPELGRIAGTGFEHAVSFHGWGEEGIAIGGRAPRTLRESVRDAVAEAVDGDLRVTVGADDARDGSSPENFVNWLTADGDGGIQIEQSYAARTEYREAVLRGVADVLADH